MKNILTTLAIAFTLIVTAQEPISKTVGEFTTLKVYDLINVEMIKSDINKVEISGKNAEEVVVANKNGTLKIKMNIEESYDGNDTQVKLYYTNVDVIDANEGAFISSQDIIEQYDIELKTQEGGEIKLNLKVKELDVKAVTGGVVEVSGTANHENISINTGGIFKGKSLEAQLADVKIKAGGEVDVRAIEVLDIKITAGGDVFIYGQPKKINKKRALGGRIKQME
ncbi:head GIN domain-containing protein [Pontimicrobium sp. IMCC45349]|uniref:head GIN domain-containing protein n=1 Tax=Pontimicrobium sp. IMCC45349 TaxID=3391574 RepID=UPI00399EFD1F